MSEQSRNFSIFSPIQEASLQESLPLAENTNIVLVVDLDDVIQNTRPGLVERLNKILRRLHPDTPLPTRETITALGGKRAYEAFPVYGKVMDKLRRDAKTYQNVPPMEDILPEVFTKLTQAGFQPIMWLSAREEEVAQVSRMEISKLGLPDIPAYSATEYYNHTDVTFWKTSVLQRLADALPGKRIIMIDDNPELAAHVRDLQDPRIQIVQYMAPENQPVEGVAHATWQTMEPTIRQLVTA